MPRPVTFDPVWPFFGDGRLSQPNFSAAALMSGFNVLVMSDSVRLLASCTESVGAPGMGFSQSSQRRTSCMNVPKSLAVNVEGAGETALMSASQLTKSMLCSFSWTLYQSI